MTIDNNGKVDENGLFLVQTMGSGLRNMEASGITSNPQDHKEELNG